jgi:Tol biopolymer transport system component
MRRADRTGTRAKCSSTARRRPLAVSLLVTMALMAVACDSAQPEAPSAATGTPEASPEQEGTGQALSIVDVGSGTAVAFTAPSGASEFDVTLDRSMVAYSGVDENGRRQVFMMDADGSNAKQLTSGEMDASNPEWSSDGSMVAYEGSSPGASEIFTVGVSDGVSTRVTREPREAWDPTWAPDDGSIVFSTPGASGHVLLARSVDLTTGQTRTVVIDASLPALSPDGNWIVFDSYSKEPVIRLSITKGDGSERRVIAKSSEDGFAKWSPDSTQIAFIGETEDEGLGTYVYDLASRETHFVTPGMIEGWFGDSSILVSSPS